MERMDSGEGTMSRPAGAPDGWGVDMAPENRPGVPMEARPRPAEGAHGNEPTRQRSDVTHFHRKGLDQLTPVHGTAQPPKGLSGTMRKVAYDIPEHSAMHWMMLLAADRVDVIEDRLSGGVGPGTADAIRRQIRTNPVPALLIGLLAGAAIRRALR
jgi:hypothetical protein